MDTPAEPATHANHDHDIDWEYVDAHHHPVTLVRRPAYEGWVLTLFGLILVGLIGLLGWMGYALSTVKAELRQVQAHVRQLHASVAPREPLVAAVRRTPVHQLARSCVADEVDRRVPARAASQPRRVRTTRPLDEHLFDAADTPRVSLLRDPLDDVDQAFETFNGGLSSLPEVLHNPYIRHIGRCAGRRQPVPSPPRS
jgi:hypothetical protein